MVVSIIGMIIGAMIVAFGMYYLVKERYDKECFKIYGITISIGSIVFVVMLVKLIFEMMA